MEFAHRINMQIMRRFKAEGIDFAFPSQTMYLAGGSKRRLNLGRQQSHSDAVGVSSPGGTTRQADTRTDMPAGAEIEETTLHGDDDGDDTGDATN